VVVNLFEKGYPKDSYRTLAVTTANDADISVLIRVVKRKNIKLLFLDFEKDYNNNRMVVFFTLRLFYRGVTDKLSHTLLGDLERCGVPIQRIKWSH
jgi:hypothetical protein